MYHRELTTHVKCPQWTRCRRNSPSSSSISFWTITKTFMKSSSSSFHEFLSKDGSVHKHSKDIWEIAAGHCEDFFRKSEVYRRHSYTDGPDVEWENYGEEIRVCSSDEGTEIGRAGKKKKSGDAHGLSSCMFNFLPSTYWSLILQIYNHSFSTAIVLKKWRDTRILLLVKKRISVWSFVDSPYFSSRCFSQNKGETVPLLIFWCIETQRDRVLWGNSDH